MDKQEFLDGLRAALQGSVSAGLVMENVNYYEDYINTEIRKGKTEAEVLSTLGDPRLIAKTIVQTQGKSEGGAYSTASYRNASQGNSQYQGGARGYQGDPQYQSGTRGYQGEAFGYGGNDEKRRVLHLPGWLVGVLVAIVLLVVFSFIFSVLTYLAPVILVVAAVIFVVKLFQDWLS